MTGIFGKKATSRWEIWGGCTKIDRMWWAHHWWSVW